MIRMFEHKLKIPVYSSSLPRKRLHSFLDKQCHNSLISITGDAGYGKTTLISGYIQKKNIPTIWYQLDEMDKQPHVFLSYIKAGITREISNIGTFSPLQPDDTENEFQNLLSVLSNWSDPLYIVLDNYQHIEQDDSIKHLINQFLQYSSPAVTFIFIGQVYPISIPVSLKLRRRFIEINQEQLSFTKKETDEFFNTLHGISLHPHEINAIHDKTQGWITSILLILQAIEDMKETDRTEFLINFSGNSDIHDYFTLEVMNSQPKEIKLFLLQTSLLTEMNATIINQYLDISNAQEILNNLLTRNVFVYKDEQGIIRYHPLFRSYLYEKFLEELSFSELNIEHYHLKLAEIYKDKCQLFSSFVHYMEGKDYYQATQLIRNMENRYNPDKFMVLIHNWLDRVYAQETIPFDSIFLFRCIPLSILDQLILPIEKFMNVLLDNKNHLQLSHLQYFLATIYRHKGEFDKSKSLFLTSLDYCQEMNIHATTVLNLIGLSEIHLCSGQCVEAETYAKHGLYHSEKYQISHCQIYALWALAEFHLYQNDTEHAIPLLEQMGQLLKESREDDARSVYLYYSMSRAFSLQKEIAKAIKFSTLAVNLAEKFGNDLDFGGANLQLGQCYMEAREWEKAAICLEKAATALEYFSYYRCLTISFQVKLLEWCGKNKQANELKNELLPLCQKKQYNYLLAQVNQNSYPNLNFNDLSTKHKLSIEVLGDFKVTYEGEPVIIKRKSSLQLLQLLIANRRKKLQKDFLLDAIFPNAAIDSVNNQFYVALSMLRKSLEPGLKSGRESCYINQLDNHYIFNTKDLYLDADEFLDLITDLKPTSNIEVEKLLKAEAIYKGNFFEDYPYDAFLEQERENLRANYLRLLQTLAHYYWDTNDYSNGIKYFEKILKEDPYQEQVYLDFIHRLIQANLLVQAKQVAERNIKFVEKELGINVRNNLNSLFRPFSITV